MDNITESPTFKILVQHVDQYVLGDKNEAGEYVPETWDLVEYAFSVGLISKREYMRLCFKSYTDHYVWHNNGKPPKWKWKEGFADGYKPGFNPIENKGD